MSTASKSSHIPTLLIIFVLTILITLIPVLYLNSRNARHFAALPPPLNVITLAFGPLTSPRILEHNCAMIRDTPHNFYIHTDNTSYPVCRYCVCKAFKPVNCPCPNPNSSACNHCEKLRFVIDRIAEYPSVLFLDSDLIIMKETFLHRLYPRTRVHDALAAYGHMRTDLTKYFRHFNSGLLFLRRLDVDYEEMWRWMYQERSNQDQGFISRFVQKRYANWDVLSIRWHCRFIIKGGYEIPPEDCYTLHDRTEQDAILKKLNYTFRRLA